MSEMCYPSGGVRVKKSDASVEFIPFQECSPASDVYEMNLSGVCMPEGEGVQASLKNETGGQEDVFVMGVMTSSVHPEGPHKYLKHKTCWAAVAAGVLSGVYGAVGINKQLENGQAPKRSDGILFAGGLIAELGVFSFCLTDEPPPSAVHDRSGNRENNRGGDGVKRLRLESSLAWIASALVLIGMAMASKGATLLRPAIYLGGVEENPARNI